VSAESIVDGDAGFAFTERAVDFWPALSRLFRSLSLYDEYQRGQFVRTR